jgi:Cu/Ag efflux pump CusA
LITTTIRLAERASLGKVIVDGSMERLVLNSLNSFGVQHSMVPLVIGSGAGREIFATFGGCGIGVVWSLLRL